jgi:hypothetical protein
MQNYLSPYIALSGSRGTVYANKLSIYILDKISYALDMASLPVHLAAGNTLKKLVMACYNLVRHNDTIIIITIIIIIVIIFDLIQCPLLQVSITYRTS